MKSYHTLENIFKKLNHLAGAIGNLKNEMLHSTLSVNANENRIDQICTLESIKYDILTSDFIQDLITDTKKEALKPPYSGNLDFFYKVHHDTKIIPLNLVLDFVKSSLKCAIEWPLARKEKSFKRILPSFTLLIKAVQAILALHAARFNCTKYDALLKLKYTDINSKLIDKIYAHFGQFLKNNFSKIKAKQQPNFFEERPVSYFKKCELVNKVLQGFNLPDVNFNIQDNILYLKSLRGVEAEVETGGSILLLLRSLLYEIGKIAYKDHNKNYIPHLSLFNNLNDYNEESYGFLFSQQVMNKQSFEEFFVNIKKSENAPDKNLLIPNKKLSDYKQIIHISPLMSQSDDLTSLVHSMLGYNLEKDLLEGTLEVKDLPEAWNEDTKHYLDLTVKNDAEGCLQNKNWYKGIFGYYPIYLISSLLSHKLIQEAGVPINDIENFISLGNFHQCFQAIINHTVQSGNESSANKLIKAVIKGNPTYLSPYKRYLTERFKL